jgi:hypothetical protein
MANHPKTKVGDTIQTTVKHPTPAVIKVVLETPESCAFANKLLLDKKSGWQLAKLHHQ